MEWSLILLARFFLVFSGGFVAFLQSVRWRKNPLDFSAIPIQAHDMIFIASIFFSGCLCVFLHFFMKLAINRYDFLSENKSYLEFIFALFVICVFLILVFKGLNI